MNDHRSLSLDLGTILSQDQALRLLALDRAIDQNLSDDTIAKRASQFLKFLTAGMPPPPPAP